VLRSFSFVTLYVAVVLPKYTLPTPKNLSSTFRYSTYLISTNTSNTILKAQLLVVVCLYIVKPKLADLSQKPVIHFGRDSLGHEISNSMLYQ